MGRLSTAESPSHAANHSAAIHRKWCLPYNKIVFIYSTLDHGLSHWIYVLSEYTEAAFITNSCHHNVDKAELTRSHRIPILIRYFIIDRGKRFCVKITEDIVQSRRVYLNFSSKVNPWELQVWVVFYSER